MKKIIIPHGHLERDLCVTIKNLLENFGYEVTPADSLLIHSNMFRTVDEFLKEYDAVIPMIRGESYNSSQSLKELDTTLTYTNTPEDKLFLPILIGHENNLIDYFRDKIFEYIPNGSDIDATNLVLNIHKEVDRHKLSLAEKRHLREEQAKRLEAGKTEFIRDAEERLTQKEQSLNSRSNIWYWTGYLALIFGVVIAYVLIEKSLVANITINTIIILSIKGIIGISLLVASSKYAFTLGKSYMNESLKNSDRLHAISFGKFYLQAYGDVVSPEDVKEVFQHWNIDRDSSFRELSAKNFDPRFLETAVEIAAILSKSESADEKKSKT